MSGTPLRRSTRKAAKAASVKMSAILTPSKATPATSAPVTEPEPVTKAPKVSNASPRKRSPFHFDYFDPTFLFTISIAKDPSLLLELVTEPLCIISWVSLIVIYYVATSGKQANLEAWEKRAAMWYLLNAIVFHFLLDFGVGTLKHFPSMVQNYQAMDIRYGCIADFPCGTATGIVTTSEPMVWVLTVIEAFIDTPLCILCFFAYLKGWSCRKPLEVAIAVSHIVGTIMFQGTEFYNGLVAVPPPPANVGGADGMFSNLTFDPSNANFEAQAVYFWFSFIICNSIWYVVPGRLAIIAWESLLDAVDDRKDRAKIYIY